MTMGPIALQNYYFEFKRQQEEAMKNALTVIQDVNNNYGEITGRTYGNGLVDAYHLEDAEVAVICLGSTAGTMKTVVDKLRKQGVKAGLLRIRTFRPFPSDAIRSALKNVKAIAAMDKSMSFGGNGGPVYHELRHALYDSDSKPFIVNYIYGLGGRDTSPTKLSTIYEDLQQIIKTQTIESPIKYLGLRE
jgi:pyruvate ferredoxin oxidoreductase alpha subunit